MQSSLTQSRLELIYLEKTHVLNQINELEVQSLISRDFSQIKLYLNEISELERKLDKLETIECYSSNLSAECDW